METQGERTTGTQGDRELLAWRLSRTEYPVDFPAQYLKILNVFQRFLSLLRYFRLLALQVLSLAVITTNNGRQSWAIQVSLPDAP
jgi:hypothetical protein